MTGFASEFKSFPNYDISMEIKSVNSRYFEFKLKSYSSMDEWENEIKNIIFEKLKRGKIDLYIKIIEKDAKNIDVIVNYELAKKYEEAVKSLAKQLDIVSTISMKDFLFLGNILQSERIGGYEDIFDSIKLMLVTLLEKVLEMMIVEGEKTKEDIENSLKTIVNSVKVIDEFYPESLDNYKKNVKDRIIELFPGNLEDPISNNRLMMEIELVSSRTAINEELVRLKSHLNQFQNIINGKTGGDSKKLDFIGQEMNRETNTIASKSSDYRIIENTIVIKGEIEKIREQLRNLE
jgi:uncharacterized protein (TIGR00255 family)